MIKNTIQNNLWKLPEFNVTNVTRLKENKPYLVHSNFKPTIGI